MKVLLLTVLFVPIIYLAFKEKKWYLYLVFAFFGMLPEQLGFNPPGDLPLISASRVLLVILICFWAWDRWKKREFSIPKSLLLFLILNTVVSIVNLRYGMSEIKRIFTLVIEQVLLVIIARDTIDSREEFDKCVDFLIMGCMAVGVIGIVQNVWDYDIASVMHFSETIASIKLQPRMGMTRAYGTFNAITLGCYSAFMLLPIYYRLANTKKLRYSAAMALDIMTMICTFTRSAWICAAVMVVLMLVIFRKQFIGNIWRSVVFAIVLCAVLCLLQPNIFNALVETTKSVINTALGVAYEDQRGMSDNYYLELSEDFGANAEAPTYSRMMQWSAIDRIVDDGDALFGYGYNFLQNGKLHFYLYEQWEQVNFIDVGMVALVAESGFVGAAAMAVFIACMFLQAFKMKTKTAEFDFHKLVLLTIPMLLMLNYVSVFFADNTVWLFYALIGANEKLTAGSECRQLSA